MSILTEAAIPALIAERAELIAKVDGGAMTDEAAEPLLTRAWAIEDAVLNAPVTSAETAQALLRLVADTFDKGPLTSRSDAVALTAVLAFLIRWGAE